MEKENISSEEHFYCSIADIIGCSSHDYRPYPFRERTRWNTRFIGNGRFPGHGIIRRFNEKSIHVQLHTPAVKGVFLSESQAIEAIRLAMSKHS